MYDMGRVEMYDMESPTPQIMGSEIELLSCCIHDIQHMDSDEPSTVVQVRNANMDSPDWEYALAGHLIGTEWLFPDRGVVTVRRAQYTKERVQGERIQTPEVVMDTGQRISVSGFLRRIDPNDIGDVEPSGKVARRIVDVHTRPDFSWRKTGIAAIYPVAGAE